MDLDKQRCFCCTKILIGKEANEALKEVKSKKLAHHYCDECFDIFKNPNSKYDGLKQAGLGRGDFEWTTEDVVGTPG